MQDRQRSLACAWVLWVQAVAEGPMGTGGLKEPAGAATCPSLPWTPASRLVTDPELPWGLLTQSGALLLPFSTCLFASVTV